MVKRLLQENRSVPDRKDPIGGGFYQTSVPIDLLAPILVGDWFKKKKKKGENSADPSPCISFCLKQFEILSYMKASRVL